VEVFDENAIHGLRGHYSIVRTLDRLRKEGGVKNAASAGPDFHPRGCYNGAIHTAASRTAATLPEGERRSVKNA
jgi:hypothetical protein